MFTQVPMEKIRPNPDQPRKSFDPGALEDLAFQRGLDLGYSAAEIEESAGLAKGAVTWKLALLQCVDSVQFLVERGQFTVTNASTVSRLSANGQQRAMREYQQRKLGQTEFRELVNLLYAEENALDMFPETKVTPEAKAAADAFRTALKKIAEGATAILNMDKDRMGPALQFEADKIDREIAGLINTLYKTSTFMQRLRGRAVAQEVLMGA